MIGELYFPFHNHKVKAILTDELVWSSQDKSVEEYLNAICVIAPSRNNDRKSEIHQLYQIGERLGAEVTIVRSSPRAHATV
jgi:hypothetical protein